MAWDANRPVPWRRLVREWLIYVAIMAAVMVFFFRDQELTGILAALLASGPIYLAIGYALAKFGYQRKQIKDVRGNAPAPKKNPDADADDRPRRRPAPTKRTAGGTPPNRSGKRRR